MLGHKYVAIGISTCNNYVVHARLAHSSGLSAGFVFDYGFYILIYVQVEARARNGVAIFCIVHFALMQNEPKNQDLLK